MKRAFLIFSSLKLTVALLALAMGLIFWGTLEQIHIGVHAVQSLYFGSWIAWFPLGPRAVNLVHARYYLTYPGGYSLGALFLINLICAHYRYFKPAWNKVGIALIHGGIVVLIVSGFVSSLYQEEAQMTIDEGKSAHYCESFTDNELAIVDVTDPQHPISCALPVERIKHGELITLPELSLAFKAIAYYENAALVLRSQMPSAPPTLATRGGGVKMDIGVIPEPPTYRPNEYNAATAYVSVFVGDEDIGTWLVSNVIDERFPPQQFEENGRTFQIALRFKRHALPFSLELLKFTHTKYPGTEIPKSFVSDLILHDAGKPDRAVMLSMNTPLRYWGWTFYQASFANEEHTTVLQCVKNPGWTLPYIAVAIVAAGLAFHFILKLIQALRTRKEAA